MTENFGQYGINLDQLDIHLAAMAGVLGRFRKGLIDAGFGESEAAALALEWWRSGLTEEE